MIYSIKINFPFKIFLKNFKDKAISSLHPLNVAYFFLISFRIIGIHKNIQNSRLNWLMQLKNWKLIFSENCLLILFSNTVLKIFLFLLICASPKQL